MKKMTVAFFVLMAFMTTGAFANDDCHNKDHKKDHKEHCDKH